MHQGPANKAVVGRFCDVSASDGGQIFETVTLYGTDGRQIDPVRTAGHKEVRNKVLS